MPPRNRLRNPFRGVMDVISEMNRISDAMSSIETSSPSTQARGYADAWTPATDIFARGSDLVVRCELAGVAPDRLEVSFSHGVLFIHGERSREEGTDLVYYTSERFHGAFRREITLPEGIAEEQIEAHFEEGLLDITVRNAAEASGPKNIRIRTKKK